MSLLHSVRVTQGPQHVMFASPTLEQHLLLSVL